MKPRRLHGSWRTPLSVRYSVGCRHLPPLYLTLSWPRWPLCTTAPVTLVLWVQIRRIWSFHFTISSNIQLLLKDVMVYQASRLQIYSYWVIWVEMVLLLYFFPTFLVAMLTCTQNPKSDWQNQTLESDRQTDRESERTRRQIRCESSIRILRITWIGLWTMPEFTQGPNELNWYKINK